MRFLAALFVLAYVASALISGDWWDIPANALLDLGASHAPAIAAGEVWRLVSALFLHGGLLHLLFNGVALIEIGRPLEKRLGTAIPLTLFLLTGAAGFLASLLWQPESVSVGASGGIFGLLAAWALMVATQPVTDPTRRHRPLIGATLVVVLALAAGLLIPGVDHAAHLGGLAAGLLLAAIGAGAKWRRPIFFASAAGLAVALLIACQLLPASWRTEHEESREYAQRYHLFAEEDRAINRALQAIGEESRAGTLSDAAGLERIDRQLLPRLQRSTAAMRDRAWQTPRIVADVARWEIYARYRVDAVTALRNAIAANDPATATDELRRFERLMAQAAQVAREPPADNPQAQATPDR